MTWHASLASLVALLLILGAPSGAAAPEAVSGVQPSVAQLFGPTLPAAAPPPTGQAPAPAPAPSPVPLSGPRPASLDEAEQARRNGDFDGAAAVLRLLAEQGDPSIRDEALLRLAVALVEAGRGQEAAEAARELRARGPEPGMRARALFLLGRAQRTVGDCAGALASWSEVERIGSELGPYLDLQMADCHARLNDRVGQAAGGARAAAAATARLARVDALEHQADAALKRGDPAGALAPSEQLLGEAGTRAYRAQTLTSIGNIQRELGRREEAVRAYATVVAELPETTFAPTALDGLARLDALNAVGPDQVGLVRHFQGRHGEAVVQLSDGLSQGLPPDRAASALYHQGISLLRLDRTDAAVDTFRRLAFEHPSADLAPRGLLRAARGLESEGRFEEAGTLHRQAADTYPDSAAGQQAHQRLVYSLYRRGATPEAIAAARELAGRGAEPAWKGLALFWAGKALARVGDSGQAEQVWRQAADLAPDDFGGLRARAVLAGELRPSAAARPFDPAVLAGTEADRGEIDAWLAARGADAGTLAAEQAADAGYARAAELFRLGLREQAGWELQEIAARIGQDPARLYWLARFAAERGDAQLGIRFAVEARRASGEPFGAQPRLLQRLIYPLPFAELIVANAERRGVDPLLFAALVRQESAFSARAHSSAGALGLAQVMPTTGEGIARALGRPDFKTDDLLRPVVSVEFGIYYLSTQLNAYGGRLFPALAAYNAGGGNVNGWLRQYGDEDPDVFAEQIPFAETNHYVQIVYENYGLYRRLYGGG